MSGEFFVFVKICKNYLSLTMTLFHSFFTLKVTYLVRFCTVNADHIAHSTSSFFIPRIIQPLGHRHSICINLHFKICSCTLFTACQSNLKNAGESKRCKIFKKACVTSSIKHGSKQFSGADPELLLGGGANP